MAPSYNTGVLSEMIRAEITQRGRGAQARLAEALGLPAATVNKWYLGKNAPEPHRWPHIERHFGWDEGEIVRRVVPSLGTDTVAELVSRLADQVLALERRLSVLEARQPRSDPLDP